MYSGHFSLQEQFVPFSCAPHTDKADCDMCSNVCSQIDSNGFTAALGAANRLNTGITQASAWGTETVLTCILVFTVFAATDTTRSQKSAHLSVQESWVLIRSQTLAPVLGTLMRTCWANNIADLSKTEHVILIIATTGAGSLCDWTFCASGPPCGRAH